MSEDINPTTGLPYPPCMMTVDEFCEHIRSTFTFDETPPNLRIIGFSVRAYNGLSTVTTSNGSISSERATLRQRAEHEIALTKAVPSGVSVLITCDGEKFIASCRANTETFPGTYQLPGGSINPGETAAQAATREVKEETGIEIPLGKLTPSGMKRFTRANGDPYNMYAFVVKLRRSDFGVIANPEPDKQTDLRLYNKTEVAGKTWVPGNQEMIERYFRLK